MFTCRIVTNIGHDTVARRAISLVEVMLVIAMVMFMLALLIPGVNGARERARRVVCSNNLRQWGIALQFYRDEHNDYLPKEGTSGGPGLFNDSAWFNALPPYLGLPPYRDFDRMLVEMDGDEKKLMRELPGIHVWICPSKNLTGAYKSKSGMNQFHYGMNQVLDGVGTEERPSSDVPGFLDMDRDDPDKFLLAKVFRPWAHTVFMFDIVWNSPCGKPRDVATMYQRNFGGSGYIGKFHGDYANILYLSGRVGNCKTDDLVTDRNFRHGEVIWDNAKLYWGYPPPWGVEEVDEEEQ